MRGAILSLCLLQTVLLAFANSQPAVLSDFAAARQRMVEEQLSAPGRDIKNRLVLEAMATVPRHEFVPESLRKFAYWDEPTADRLRSDHFPAIHCGIYDRAT
jgi:protein-L-isoaspartate(D-aspartate) O-methyltransferase